MSSLNKILCIPEIGTRVRLQEDWTFVLYDEHRNKSMMELYGLSRGHWQSYGKPIDFITLPAGIEMFPLSATPTETPMPRFCLSMNFFGVVMT